MKNKEIYKPKPLKEWKLRLCTGATDKYKLILMSETGYTGDNMFHAFIQAYNKQEKRFKTNDEIKKESEDIYNTLLSDIINNPSNYKL